MPPRRASSRSLRPTPRKAARGFTLIEIGVVIGLMALMVGVVIPSLSSVSGATARATVTKLVSNIRAARDKALVIGGTCRVAFDLDKDVYSVECTKQPVAAVGAMTDDDEEPVTPEDLEDMDPEERYEHEIKMATRFNGEVVLEGVPLDGGVTFKEIVVQHADEPQEKGVAYLYFFSSGLGERANIQLSRSDDEQWSILVSPLSNRLQVVPGFVKLRDLDDED